jgi:sugar/nucleoside kinase (ribokinase family)
MEKFDIILVGHFAHDRIVVLVRGENSSASGGAVFYGGYALAALRSNAAIITHASRECVSELDLLRRTGIKIFETIDEVSTGIENVYLDDIMDRRICRLINQGKPFRKEEIPEIEAKIIHIAPLLVGEVDEDFVKHAGTFGKIGLDAQGFIRVAERDKIFLKKREEFFSILKFAHYLKTDHAEAEVLTGTTDIEKALKMLAEFGPEEILLTHSKGVSLLCDGARYNMPWLIRHPVGRTGRGDTCASSYLACRTKGLSPEDSLKAASLITSHKLKHEGPFRGDPEKILGKRLWRKIA